MQTSLIKQALTNLAHNWQLKTPQMRNNRPTLQVAVPMAQASRPSQTVSSQPSTQDVYTYDNFKRLADKRGWRYDAANGTWTSAKNGKTYTDDQIRQRLSTWRTAKTPNTSKPAIRSFGFSVPERKTRNIYFGDPRYKPSTARQGKEPYTPGDYSRFKRRGIEITPIPGVMPTSVTPDWATPTQKPRRTRPTPSTSQGWFANLFRPFQKKPLPALQLDRNGYLTDENNQAVDYFSQY